MAETNVANSYIIRKGSYKIETTKPKIISTMIRVYIITKVLKKI
jgi:hypothetical protein